MYRAIKRTESITVKKLDRNNQIPINTLAHLKQLRGVCPFSRHQSPIQIGKYETSLVQSQNSKIIKQHE